MVSALLIPPLSSSVPHFNGKKFRVHNHASTHHSKPSLNRFRVRAIKEKTEEIKNQTPPASSAEEITQKFGLEAGLWKVPISLFLVLFFSVLFLFRSLYIWGGIMLCVDVNFSVSFWVSNYLLFYLPMWRAS